MKKEKARKQKIITLIAYSAYLNQSYVITIPTDDAPLILSTEDVQVHAPIERMVQIMADLKIQTFGDL